MNHVILFITLISISCISISCTREPREVTPAVSQKYMSLDHPTIICTKKWNFNTGVYLSDCLKNGVRHPDISNASNVVEVY
jgi:hypothetical protein